MEPLLARRKVVEEELKLLQTSMDELKGKLNAVYEKLGAKKEKKEEKKEGEEEKKEREDPYQKINDEWKELQAKIDAKRQEKREVRNAYFEQRRQYNEFSSKNRRMHRIFMDNRRKIAAVLYGQGRLIAQRGRPVVAAGLPAVLLGKGDEFSPGAAEIQQSAPAESRGMPGDKGHLVLKGTQLPGAVVVRGVEPGGIEQGQACFGRPVQNIAHAAGFAAHDGKAVGRAAKTQIQAFEHLGVVVAQAYGASGVLKFKRFSAHYINSIALTVR